MYLRSHSKDSQRRSIYSCQRRDYDYGTFKTDSDKKSPSRATTASPHKQILWSAPPDDMESRGCISPAC